MRVYKYIYIQGGTKDTELLVNYKNTAQPNVHVEEGNDQISYNT